MAIKIGQIRYNNNTNYLSSVAHTLTEYTTIVGATSFKDFAISANFQAGVTYYIRVNIARINNQIAIIRFFN